MSRGKAPQSFDELVNLWLAEIVISEVTKRAYRLELRRFIRWARHAGKDIATVDSQSIADFGRCISSDRPKLLQPLGVSKPLLASSLGQTRRIVGAWLRWAAAEGLVSASLAAPVDWPIVDRKSNPKKLIAARLLDNVLSPNTKSRCIGLKKAREKFVVGLTFWLGLSSEEIAALRRDEIRVRAGRFEVLARISDGSTDWIPAPEQLLHAWKSYEKERGNSKLAVTDIRTGNKVSAGTVKRIVRGIKTPKISQSPPGLINSRQLRRSFIKHAIDCGWTPEDLKRHLRRQAIAAVPMPRESKRKWISKLEALDSSFS